MIFIRKAEALELHRRLLERYGGADGLRDEAALEGALIAAENCAWYENADVVACAAAYAFHLAQAHAFADGNKRVAAACMLVFLTVNGAQMEATIDELEELFMGIARGELDRAAVEEVLRGHVTESLSGGG